MKKIIVGLLLAASASVVYADGLVLPGRYELSPNEVKLELVFDATLLMDYGQSRDIKNHPGHYETNPILGPHPHDDKIMAYFVLAGLGHYAVTKALLAEWRPAWQYSWIAIEIAQIIKNRQLGIGFEF